MGVRPKLKISFKERDLGMSHLLKEAAKLRKKPFVKVGVTQAKGSKLHIDPVSKKQIKTVADIAAFHEYGAPDANIPERSFIRSTVEKNKDAYDSHIAQLHEKIFDADSGMTTEKALGLIGQEVTADMKNTIREGIPPELKPETIARKNKGKSGGSTPLIDTGQLVNSLNYQVVPEGEGDASYSGEGPRSY